MTPEAGKRPAVTKVHRRIATGLFVAAILTHSVAPAGAGANTGRWIALSDSSRRVYVVEQGRGETVLFVHGTLLDYRCWKAVAPALARRFHVVTYSRWGHYPAREAPAIDRYSYGQHAADLAQLIRQVAPQGVHLVGHSYGGVVTAMLAREHPELVRSLILIEPYTVGLIASQATRDTIRARRQRTLAESGGARTEDAKIRTLLAGITGDPNLWRAFSPERQRELRDNAATIPGLNKPQPAYGCEDVSKLTVPILLIEGGRTNDVFREIDAGWHACAPRSQLETVPAAGHFVMWDRPRELSAAIERFLRGVAGPAAR